MADLFELTTGFEAIRAGDTDEFAKIHDRLDQAAAERAEHSSRAILERKQYASQAALLIRATLRAIGAESRDCPRLFTLAPVNRGWTNVTSWVKKSHRLTLWCEYPDHMHPTCEIGTGGEGEYLVSQSRAWMRTLAPYGKVVAVVLSATLPIAGVATKVALDSTTSDEIGAMVDLMNSTTTGVVTAFGGTDFERDDRLDAIKDRAQAQVGGAGLRQLHDLLLQIDPSRDWGGLRRTLAPTGEFLWLCPEHYRVYDPGFPTLPE